MISAVRKTLAIIAATLFAVCVIGAVPTYANNVQTAEPIYVGDSLTYRFYDNDDDYEYEHYYKFDVPETGYYQIDLDNFSEDSSIDITDKYGDYVAYGSYDQYQDRCWLATRLKKGHRVYIKIYNPDSNEITITLSKHTHSYKNEKKYDTGLYRAECRVPECEYTKYRYSTRPNIKKLTTVNKKGKKIKIEYGYYSTIYNEIFVEYSTSSKFPPSKTVRGTVESEYTGVYSNPVKKGKKYYFRIRFVYKDKSNDHTEYFYSNWSKVKSIKVK